MNLQIILAVGMKGMADPAMPSTLA